MITNKFVIPSFLFCILFFANSSSLCSDRELTQKRVFAAETTFSATPSAETSPSTSIGELPTVHILPDNPLYFLKTIKEKVQLLVTRKTSSQADLLLDFSQKRLAEAIKVAEKGKIHISEKLFEAFGEDIAAAQEKIRKAKEEGETTYNLLVELQKTIAYQKSVIEKLGGQAAQLSSFLVEIDQSLEATESASGGPSATTRGKIQPGPVIFDWIRGLFGKKEILKPLVE